MLSKEEAYDELIYPLMDQIIQICQEHKIANICSFSIGEEDEGTEGMCCTTCLISPEYDTPEKYLKALSIIYPKYLASLALKDCAQALEDLIE